MKKQVVVALFATVFLFSLAIASAYEWSNIGSDTKDFLINFATGAPDPAIAKWLFFFMVFLVLYSLTEVIPFFEEKSWISLLFALAVSFLSVFFLTTEQIMSSLLSYKALGIALTSVVPFLCMVAISHRCYKKKQPWSAKILWLLFIVGLLWLLVNGYAFSETTPEGSFGWIYVVVLALAVIMLFMEGKIHYYFYKSEIQRGIADADTKVQREALIKILELEAKKIAIGSVAAAKAIDDEIKELKKIAKLK
jgi:hypothetical protein